MAGRHRQAAPLVAFLAAAVLWWALFLGDPRCRPGGEGVPTNPAPPNRPLGTLQGKGGASEDAAPPPRLGIEPISSLPSSPPTGMRLSLPVNSTADDEVLLKVLESLNSIAPERPWPELLFVVQLNYAFIEFAENFIFHASRTQPPSTERLLFVSLDNLTHEALLKRGAHSYRAPGNFSHSQMEFRTGGWNQIMHNKFTMIRQLHKLGFDVLLLDVDALLLRNPLNYLIDLPMCDVYLSAEQVNNTRLLSLTEDRWGGQYDHKGSKTPIQLNAGVMLWRHTLAAQEALLDFSRPKFRRKVGDEQMELNHWFVHTAGRSAYRHLTHFALGFNELRTKCATMAGLNVMVLPPCLFSTRPQAYIGKLADLASTTPYIVHYNWGFGTGNKQGGIQSGGMWMQQQRVGSHSLAGNVSYNVSGFPYWAEGMVGNVLEAFVSKMPKA